jgi:peptidoglycan/xylan/chitin deacetylase (PgdA/CDA1 family)
MKKREILFNISNNIGVNWCLRKEKETHLTVLSLHRISEERDYFFQPITPKNFENLLDYVTKKYTIINFEILSQKKIYNKPPLILSFDDGYYDFIDFALPILRKYGLPANHNLVNNCLNGEMKIWTQELNDIFNFLKINKIKNNIIIEKNGRKFSECNNSWFVYYNNFYRYLCGIKYDERNIIIEKLKHEYRVVKSHRMMNWDDAFKLVGAGIEIGSHSYRHDALSSLQTEEEMQLEIRASIEEMKQKLGVNITILAPPNGLYNETIISYAKKIGVKNFLAVNNNITPLKTISSEFNVIERIGMADEGKNEMIARAELFHSKVRRFLSPLTRF